MQKSAQRHGLSVNAVPMVSAAIAGLLVGLAGCSDKGPELINVSGTVTLDGQPVPFAELTFNPNAGPDDQVRPAYGRTNKEGKYELKYSLTRSGARPGKYFVSISTKREARTDKDGTQVSASRETLPAVYNRRSKLEAEVSRDNRTIDFHLKSDAGEVIQPKLGED